MATLADLLEQMNAATPAIRRHHNRGRMYQDRYAGPQCHCVVDCDCRDTDGDDAPSLIHAQLPED